MSYNLLSAVFISGAAGLIAQVILLRELLVSYTGTELSLGIILANWLVGEAIGALAAGKIIARVRNKTAVFAALQIVFSLALPACIYLARTFKVMAGMPAGEAVGLPLMFFSSFLIMLPAGFSHAALFSCGCKILSLHDQGLGEETGAGSIAKIYAIEIAGTIIGGFMLTYILLTRFNAFQIAFFVSAASLLANLPLLILPRLRILKYLSISLCGIAVYFLASGSVNQLQEFSLARQFSGAGKVIACRNSVYGNIVVVEKDRQRTFFYNGLPAIVSPLPDVTFTEEFGNLPLLFHYGPKKVLVLGGGAGGLIRELLKYPLEKIDYVEPDALLVRLFEKYTLTPWEAELGDKRVRVINTDTRRQLRNSRDRYDVILIGPSSPHDLITNRLFTAEFFSLSKERLDPAGILAFCLPGSLAYLSGELRDLNASVLNAVKEQFPFIRIIPGDYNMFLVSASPSVTEIDTGTVSSRLSERGIKVNILVPEYIRYRMDRQWLDWFARSMEGATRKVNRDSRPLAVFEMLALWNKQFSSAASKAMVQLSGIRLRALLLLIFAAALPFFLLTLLRREKQAMVNIAYSIASTGFFGMLMSLAIIFVFQVRYGYVYREISILTSLFMAGSAIGSIWAMRLPHPGKNSRTFGLLIKVEAAIIVFALALTVLADSLYSTGFSYALLLVLSFIAGVFIGQEFILAGKLYLNKKKEAGEVSGMLYFVDLAGGCAGGILGGVFLLPVIGISGTCIAVAFLKSTSLALLVFTKNTAKTL